MNEIIQLSETEHVLKRSGRYLGGIKASQIERFYLKEDNIVFGKISYVPALLKIIREVLDNSIDNSIKNNFKFGNKIDIIISRNTVTIKDNGTGIPVKKAEGSKELMPTLAWCSLRAGSNFNDEDINNTTLGQNGEGSVLCNIFSKEFIGETCDGNLYYKVICKDNLNSKVISTKKSKKRFTKVSFKPDLDRMGLEEIEDIYMDLLEFDLLFLQETFKDIKFTMKRI